MEGCVCGDWEVHLQKKGFNKTESSERNGLLVLI